MRALTPRGSMHPEKEEKMRMMFAVGRLNRVRSKIVVAGRLRDAEAGLPLAAGRPLAPPHNPLTGPNQLVQDGSGSPGVDRARSGGGALPQGIRPLRDHEGGSRVH